jgi:SAM-dependent methyltransferase
MTEMRELVVCPICETADRTEVSAWNGLALLEAQRDLDIARYNYAMCHGCGLVYGARRPAGRAYQELFENFDENLGRPHTQKQLVLDEQARAELRRRLAYGWAPSEEAPPAEQDWYSSLWADRMAVAPHLMLLAQHADLRGARVLDIRAKTGGFLEALRSWFGAEVYALPAFEADRFVTQEAYGIPADGLIDFENFKIPYDGQFDAILSKHMFTHALHPDEYFATLASRLKVDGTLYLYVENDDATMWKRRKNLIGELKCFHLQNFNPPTIARCMRRVGFEPLTVRHVSQSSMAVVCKLDPSAPSRFKRIDSDELKSRIDMYERWYDLSLLSLPGLLGSAFASEIATARERALRRGDATSRFGRVRVTRPLRLMHGGGYEELARRGAGARSRLRTLVAS